MARSRFEFDNVGHLLSDQARLLQYLNLGCGSRFHPDWINIDLVPRGAGVLAHDLGKGIPFPGHAFDGVYHSHLLEHFPKEGALFLTKECYRVLKVGGIIRVAVPDLEQIARLYLQALERASQGEDEWRCHYEWMMLELYDQAVREHPGGAMVEYLRKHTIPNEEFVYERLGDEARRIVEGFRTEVPLGQNRRAHPRDLFSRIRSVPQFVRTRVLKLLLGPSDYDALRIAQFRLRGEVHKWMYDRYSLATLLKQAGFQDPKVVGPTESRIASWATYHLDTKPDGTIYKPDSFYMEAMKS